ncbi:AraC family transcriptional regulator [Parabacteroides sp. BX2]|jgi:AraC family transcriptional regulator, transcriptional activator of pobA|uniref:AraC family transcriptional regulator n=1 Tax=Parabacteroides segnis TaxID=2763058 RepID=A0ABR7E8T5_9BACT|nr:MULTISPECIES: helix-turn-helix domain-containing protein [Parabacteroides]MBC5646181.1 AraC family transcriptional regulator [Parabacteroides segnis]MCM0712841.1 AraC family transcriptional regulator [Parabacteroides sp. TA-V-105]
MPVIPTHKAAQQSDFGIFLKEISPALSQETIVHAHRDDYYIFGMVDSGNCRINIDFKEYLLSGGKMMCIQPGQIHHVVKSSDIEAFLLFVDSVFVDPSDKHIIAEYALSPVPFQVNDMQQSELKQIFNIIARRIGNPENEDSKRIIQNLACASIGIITEAVRNTIRQQPKNRRHIEITLAFKELLAKEHPINKSPSHYASLLHISSVYLNEVIKNITGESTSKYIQNELILRAKRMLVHTTLNIQEIALDLGFDDYAYFSRLFTKITGMNPTSYRKKYLE